MNILALELTDMAIAAEQDATEQALLALAPLVKAAEIDVAWDLHTEPHGWWTGVEHRVQWVLDAIANGAMDTIAVLLREA